MLKDIARALRLPFIAASILPFIFGALAGNGVFNFTAFSLGLITVAATHLSANLINDYADSKSGADWQDRAFYGLFGGSKLIQENRFSEKLYLKLALAFALLSFISAIGLTLVLKKPSTIIFYLIIILLSWSYSVKPLQLAYRRLGEAVIFLAFGPALVMGGYFTQTKIFPDMKSLIMSLPFAFFTTAILFSNEVPDFSEDQKVGKFTWLSIVGRQRSFILYAILMLLGFSSIVLGIFLRYLGPVAILSLILIIPAIKALHILKTYSHNKIKLVDSSRLTITIQALASIILIISKVL